MAGRSELVRIGDVEFFVEVAEGGGPQTVSADRALSFDAVRDTVEAVASELALVWQKVRPSEATVEFGLSVTAKTGKLTGLLVDGGGSAALKISLTWRSGEGKGGGEHEPREVDTEVMDGDVAVVGETDGE